MPEYRNIKIYGHLYIIVLVLVACQAVRTTYDITEETVKKVPVMMNAEEGNCA